MHVISLRFANYDKLKCSKYHKMSDVNVGCMFPYNETQRFNSLETWLYYNGSLVTKQTLQLKKEGMRVTHHNLQ